MKIKKMFYAIVVFLGVWAVCPVLANLSGIGASWLDFTSMDYIAATGRALSAGVKYFLVDDTKLVAELVFDGVASEMPPGGNGGAYTGEEGEAKLSLKALVSPITDIPAEAGAYPEDIKVQQTSIAELAQYRIQSIVKEQAALDQLSADNWAAQYRAQQRSIQAMTDALVMKKAYQDLAKVAEMASSGKYGNYSEAASTVATRRLLLGELLALRKRVIAARVRARAETMEVDLDPVATAPGFEDESKPLSSGSTASGSVASGGVGVGGNTNDGVPTEYDNAGLVPLDTPNT